MVTVEGLIEYELDSQPVRDPGVPQYSERVIHGEIYKARPDVDGSVPPPFGVLHAADRGRCRLCSDLSSGAAGGIKPPYWDQHDEFGDTNMLVVKPEEGASLARALGKHSMVLMRRHGVTVVAANVRECVYRAVQSCRNAQYQVRAMAIGGNVASLSPGETERCGDIIGKTTGVTRSWDSWALRVAKAGGVPSASKKPPKAAAKPRRQRKMRRR